MADNTKKYKIEIDASQATDELNSVDKALKETNNNLKGIAAKGDAATGALKKIGAGMKGMGLAMKAMGVGLLISGLNLLKGMFEKNEKVVKIMETAMNFLQIVFNQVVDVVTKVWDKVSKMTNGMEKTQKVISGLIAISLTPLRLLFEGLVLTINSVMLAWEKSFLGKGDVKKIAELTKNIKTSQENIKKIGDDAIKAGKKVVDNAAGMVTEVVTVAKVAFDEGSKAIDKFDAKQVAAQAKRIANAKKNYGAMAIAAQEEIDKLEGVGEKYRQVRDDATKSFEDRRKGSDELTKTLDDQLAAMLRLASANLAQAEATYALDKSADNYNAVLQARTEKTKALADIEGKRSEAQAGRLGIQAEEQAMLLSSTQAITDRAKAQADFDASLIRDEVKKAQVMQENATKAFENQKMVLQGQIDNEKLGVAEREAAKQALLLLEQDYNNNITLLKKQQTDAEYAAAVAEIELAKKVKDEKIALEKEAIDKKNQMAQDGINTIRDIDTIATNTAIMLQQKKLKNGKITQEQYDKEVAKIQKASAKREKAYAITSAVINTAASIMKILASTPPPASFIMATAAGVMGAAQIATIAAANTNEGAASTAPSVPSVPTDSTTTAPTTTTESTGTAPNTSFSFAARTNTSETPVVKTYVLSKDVDNAAQLERSIISNATI